MTASRPKTDAGYRMVPLDPEAVEVLRRHGEVQELERMLAGDDWQDHGLVFCRSAYDAALQIGRFMAGKRGSA